MARPAGRRSGVAGRTRRVARGCLFWILVATVWAMGVALPIHPAEDGPPGGSSAQESARTEAAPAPVPVPDPTPEAIRYYRTGHGVWAFGHLLSWGLLALLLWSGASARLRSLAARVARGWYGTLVVYVTLLFGILFLLELPWAYYAEFVRPHAYGLSNQTLGKWLADSLKTLVLAVISGWLVFWIPYWLIHRSPRRWWLWTTFATLPLLFLFIMITPVVVDPWFNDFGPMKDKDLERQILDLAEKAGIEGGRVYEVEKSVDTKAVNAYVTGFGATKRIVLWDTILEKLDRDELLFVMGHEMGHYVLGHVWKSILVIWLAVGLALWALHRLSSVWLPRLGGRFGFDSLGDVASLPWILLVMSLVTFVLQPPLFAVSRHHEHEADRFGLEITRDNHAAAMAFVKLQQQNLGYPRPGLLYKLWRSTHPPLGERIDFCNAYRPWERGESLRYEERFTGKE